MSTNNMRPIHPGEILREEFLIPLTISSKDLANALKIPVSTVDGIINEAGPILPDLALRLARYFGSSPEFWMDLQTAYDLRKTRQQISSTIEHEVFPRDRAA
jgi:addiction module HigA family antidote